MRLTDRTVTNSKPELPKGKTDAIFFDEAISGFGLRVREGGSRVFIFQYSRDGHTRRMTLGPWPKISATKARELVEAAAAKVALGHDPAAEKQEAQTHKETLGEAVAAYLKVKADELRPRTYVETERYLDRTARSLHSRPLAAITQAELADLLTRVSRDSGNIAANRCRANLVALHSWAARQGKVTHNPAALTEKRKEQARDRVLAEAELAALWQALPDSDYGRIVKLLMLTGQRREEIGGLRWSEIAGGQINLPPNRTKNGKAHFVPLSQAALALLPARTGRDHVFGRGDGSDGFAGWSAAKAALDKRLGDTVAPWRLHDLRHAMSTGMHEMGVAPHVVEAVINHISGHKAGVAGRYNHANYTAERKAALDMWAAHILSLVAKRPFVVVAKAA